MTGQGVSSQAKYAVLYKCPKGHRWEGWNWSASHADRAEARADADRCTHDFGFPAVVFHGEPKDALAECRRRNEVSE